MGSADPTASGRAETPGCPECGTDLPEDADSCPECETNLADGDREGRDTRYATYFLIAGVVLGSIAIVASPVIFGALGVVCGLLARHYGRPTAGAQVAAWAVIASVIGFLLGILVLL